jgi:hypothetical protein
MFLFGFELLIPIVVIGLIVMAIGAFSSDRREPDPTGRRPYAVYLFSVVFVTLFILLFSGISVISSIVRIGLPGNGVYSQSFTYGGSGVAYSGKVAPVPAAVPYEPGPNQPAPYETLRPIVVPQPGQETPTLSPNQAPLVQRYDPNDERIRSAVQAGLVAIAAGLVLLFHARRAEELVHDPAFAEGPARRTYHVYLYAVCFVAILTTLVAGAFAVYGLFRIIAPGTSGFSPHNVERNEGIHQLITSGLLALVAVAIFHFHWRRVPGRKRQAASEPPTTTLETPTGTT